MRLLEIFLEGLVKQGFKKSEIRILGVEKELRCKLKNTSISDFSKRYRINSGTLSAMLRGKRAIPFSFVGIPSSEYRLTLKNSKIPIKIPKNITKELAYLAGLLRDGTVTIEKNQEYSCAFYSKNIKFLEDIKPKIEKTFNVNTKIQRFGDCYGVRVRSKTLCLFFNIVFGFISNQEYWDTPSIIKKSDNTIKKHYITGFFDAEGGVPHLEHMKDPKRKNMYIKFVQKNKESLEFIKSHLNSIGIETGDVYWSVNKNNLKIKMSSIKSFSSYIKPLHPEKANRLVMLNRLLSVL